MFDLYDNEALEEKPKQLEERGGAYYSDAACDLIHSIYNDSKDIQAVIVENRGAISDLPRQAAVEVSCVITKAGPVPINIGQLPLPIRGLIQQMKSFESLTVEAAISGDVNQAILALAINPLTPSDKLAKTVVLEMLEAQAQWLPQF